MEASAASILFTFHIIVKPSNFMWVKTLIREEILEKGPQKPNYDFSK